MIYRTPDRLADSDGDGVVVVNRVVTTPQARKGTRLRYLGEQDGQHVYTDGDDTLGTPAPTPTPPTPPVTPPAPPVTPPAPTTGVPSVPAPQPRNPNPNAPLPPAFNRTAVQMFDSLFLRNDAIAVTINAGGGLVGSVSPAPSDWPAYRSGGMNKCGYYLIEKNLELLMHGSVSEGFGVGYSIGGLKRDLTNYDASRIGMRGANEENGRWSARNPDGLIVEQFARLEGAKVVLDVVLINAGATTLEGVRYIRTADVDMDDDAPKGWVGSYDRDKIAFPTANKIAARGEVQAALLGVGKGLVYSIASEHPGAVASFYGDWKGKPTAMDPRSAEQAQPVGTARTLDCNVNLTVVIGDIAPGGSERFTVTLGV